MYSGGDEPVWHILEVGGKNTTKTRRLLPLDALQEWSYNVIHRPHRCKQEVSRWHNSCCFCFSSVHLLSIWKPPKSTKTFQHDRTMYACMYVCVYMWLYLTIQLLLQPCLLRSRRRKKWQVSHFKISCEISFFRNLFHVCEKSTLLGLVAVVWMNETSVHSEKFFKKKSLRAEENGTVTISDEAVCVTMTNETTGKKEILKFKAILNRKACDPTQTPKTSGWWQGTTKKLDSRGWREQVFFFFFSWCSSLRHKFSLGRRSDRVKEMMLPFWGLAAALF